MSCPGKLSPFFPVCVRESARTGWRRFIPSRHVAVVEPAETSVELFEAWSLSLSKCQRFATLRQAQGARFGASRQPFDKFRERLRVQAQYAKFVDGFS